MAQKDEFSPTYLQQAYYHGSAHNLRVVEKSNGNSLTCLLLSLYIMKRQPWKKLSSASERPACPMKLSLWMMVRPTNLRKFYEIEEQW